MTTPLHLLAAVASRAAPDRKAVVDAAAAALDDVVLPALESAVVQTSLQVFGRGASLAPPPGWKPSGVDWRAVTDADALEGFAVAVTTPEAARGEAALAMIFGSLPGPRRRVDGTMGTSETTVSWSLRRDAVAGAVVDRGLQDRAVAWTQRSFSLLDGAAGYLTLDHVTASPDGYSPYEQATAAIAAQRDFETYVWTSCWGMPLSATHVAALGGPDALAGGDRVAVHLADRSWWVQASTDIEDLTDRQIAALRAFLAPVLAPGNQGLADYDEEPALRV